MILSFGSMILANLQWNHYKLITTSETLHCMDCDTSLALRLKCVLRIQMLTAQALCQRKIKEKATNGQPATKALIWFAQSNLYSTATKANKKKRFTGRHKIFRAHRTVLRHRRYNANFTPQIIQHKHWLDVIKIAFDVDA